MKSIFLFDQIKIDQEKARTPRNNTLVMTRELFGLCQENSQAN